MRTVVVVGANRGIGLGFTQQYLEAGDEVIATYRDKSTLDKPTTISDERNESLDGLKRKYFHMLSLYQLEITDEESVKEFAKTVKKVDLLILNAGIKGYPISGTRPPSHVSQHLSDSLQVNVVAVDNLIRSFYPLLLESEDSCVVYMSSKVGLTADNLSGGYHPYRIAKAATNALIWNWSIELMLEWSRQNGQKLTKTPCAVAICPGWVRTDMGGSNADQSIEDSVTAMSKVISRVIQTKESNGLYMYNGTIADQYRIPDVLKNVLDAKEKEKTISHQDIVPSSSTS